MVLAKYQHMSILELILLVKQHILILCKTLLRVHAQTTYNQENLAFCFQLCTVAHFVGLLLLPWFSSSLVVFPYS